MPYSEVRGYTKVLQGETIKEKVIIRDDKGNYQEHKPSDLRPDDLRFPAHLERDKKEILKRIRAKDGNKKMVKR